MGSEPLLCVFSLANTKLQSPIELLDIEPITTRRKGGGRFGNGIMYSQHSPHPQMRTRLFK